MHKFLLAPILVSLACAAHAGELKPMRAVYTVTRDGSAVGDATYTLNANPDGTWTLASETRGTSGMARMLGLNVREESVFRWKDDSARGVRYDYVQDTSFKSKKRHIEFDDASQQVHVREGKDHFDYAVGSGAMDRSSVPLVVGMALMRGTKDITLPVAVQDRVQQQRYVVKGSESVTVPLGTFKASLVERTDADGKGRSWYAPNLPLPIRAEKLQGDGSTIVLELKQK